MIAGKVNYMTRIVLWNHKNIESEKVGVFGSLANFVHYRDLGFFVIDCHGIFVGLIIGMKSSLLLFVVTSITSI